MKNIQIKYKLTLIITGFTLLLVIILSLFIYSQFNSALSERVLLQLESVKKLKVLQIEKQLQDRFDYVQNLTLTDLKTENTFPGELNFYSQPYFFDSIPFINHKLKVYDITSDSPSGILSLLFVRKIDSGYISYNEEISTIQEILNERTGLGQTGESYIVGSDLKLRTRSRFSDKNPVEISIKSDDIREILNNKHQKSIISDYRGVKVFSSQELLDFAGLKYLLLTEIDIQEALFPLKSLRTRLGVFGFIIFLIITLGSYQLSSIIVKPVIRMEEQLILLSKGETDKILKSEYGSDEIGQMFQALEKLVKTLEQTTSFAREIGKGNFDVKYLPAGESDKMGQAIVLMKNQLKDFQEQEDRLRKENHSAIINGQEKERKRLAQEIHDGVGPLLTSLRIKLKSSQSIEPHSNEILEMLDNTIQEIRRISNNLMPSVLTDFGAGEAISNLVKSVSRDTSLNFVFHNDMKSESKINDTIHISLYRIVQEAINNIIKHAEATKVKLSLSEFEDFISLYISDNGKGFNTNLQYEGNGLRNIYERVKLVEGTFKLESNIGIGTTIEVEIPLI